MSMKVIYVEKCAFSKCPYCIPHSTRNDINICVGGKGYMEVRNKRKTNSFPTFCPLKDFNKTED